MSFTFYHMKPRLRLCLIWPDVVAHTFDPSIGKQKKVDGSEFVPGVHSKFQASQGSETFSKNKTKMCPMSNSADRQAFKSCNIGGNGLWVGKESN